MDGQRFLLDNAKTTGAGIDAADHLLKGTNLEVVNGTMARACGSSGLRCNLDIIWVITTRLSV